MKIVIHTKGQFNYQTRGVSQAIFDSLKARGYLKTVKGYHEDTHSVECPSDTAYQQLLKASK